MPSLFCDQLGMSQSLNRHESRHTKPRRADAQRGFEAVATSGKA